MLILRFLSIWRPFWRPPNRFGGPPIGHSGALLEVPNHFFRLIWSFQMLKIERFRPKSTCLYLQNLLKSDDFEGFEAEDILTERVYTTHRPSKCIRVWGATHNMCRSNEQREWNGCNECSTVTVPHYMYIGWYGSNNCAGAVLWVKGRTDELHNMCRSNESRVRMKWL